MMNCKQATQLLSERMDRDLSRRERFSLGFHVMMCRACRNFGRQMGSLRDMAKSYAKGDAAQEASTASEGTADQSTKSAGSDRRD